MHLLRPCYQILVFMLSDRHDRETSVNEQHWSGLAAKR